jgi:predicted ATPase
MPDPVSAVFVHSLLGYLFRYGVVLVATSNRSPEDLCMRGFRSATAVEFVQMLQERCAPLRLVGGADYRLCGVGAYVEEACVEAVVEAG